jgi:hypothetical protein
MRKVAMSQSVALILTWLVELAVAVVSTGRRDARLVAVVVVASVVTHPVVWLLASGAPQDGWWPRVLLAEVVVAFVEGVFVFVLAREPQGFVTGFAMNAASFGLGLVIAPWL